MRYRARTIFPNRTAESTLHPCGSYTRDGKCKCRGWICSCGYCRIIGRCCIDIIIGTDKVRNTGTAYIVRTRRNGRSHVGHSKINGVIAACTWRAGNI